jgi:hypothetical protein
MQSNGADSIGTTITGGPGVMLASTFDTLLARPVPAKMALAELKVSWPVDDDDEAMADRDNAINALTYALSKPDERDAVLRLALEALEVACGDRCNAEYNPCYAREAIAVIRKVLERYN